MNDDDFVTVAGAAQIARKNPGTIRRWIREGRLTKYTDGLGGRVWVDRRQVEQLVRIRPEAQEQECGA